MKRCPTLIFSLILFTLTACDEEDKTGSAICPKAEVCQSSLVDEKNRYPGGFASGMLGTYTSTYTSYNLGDVDEPFADGDIVEFELSENNRMTVKLDGECITLSRPFRYAQYEARDYFLDECTFNTIFQLNRRTKPGSPSSGGIYDILDRILVGNGFANSYGVFCFPNEWNSCE